MSETLVSIETVDKILAVAEDAGIENVHYVVMVGSQAYGTATKDSDIDVRCVYVPRLNQMIEGFPVARVHTMNIDDLDIVFQPFHKFLKLCAGANPNILDWLFVPVDCVLLTHTKFDIWKHYSRRSFLSKNLYPRFKGYAHGHFQKMERGVTRHLGDKRKQDVEEHGYSTKNAMHLIRLARMGCEALETGKYLIRRPDAEELLAIRRGAWSLPKVKAEGTKLLERMDKAFETTKLPDGISMDEVAQMVIDYVK